MSEPPAPRSNGEDWFGEGAWLEASTEERAATRRARPRRWKASGLVLAIVLATVALVLIALALGGVFSSDDESARPQAVEPVPPPPPATINRQPSPPLPTRGQIAPGEEGRQVRLLQQALAELGYKPGRVDGKLGTKTRQALERFQRKAGLEPDGIAGPKTLRALNQALIRARS
jgi:type IV secretory pathway VirB10-like protein